MRYPIFMAVALLGAACAGPKKEPPPKPFVATLWTAQLELPIPGEQPTLRFGDGRMEGFGGCNRISARVVQDSVGARAIAFGRIDRGTRTCTPGAQAAESRLLEVLHGATSYSITGDTMTITGSAGTMKFRAPPDPVPAAAAK